jgi:hypothetical protein
LLAKQDHYEPARQLAETALAVARQGGDSRLSRQALARLQMVREAQAANDEARIAQAELKRRPDDADAALRLGRFYCLITGDWESGLRLLARGSDPTLKKFAQQDLAQPSSSADQVVLADQWWDLGERMAGTAKTQVRQHACAWYKRALSTLDKGLIRQRVEQRLEEITTVADSEKPSDKASAQSFRWSDLPRLVNLRLIPSWERLRPRKTLQAQTVKDSLTLTKEDSPYLIVGFLAVEPTATLTIDPGVIVLFAPDAQLTNKGRLTMTSQQGWIVLAPAGRGGKWKGIYSQGHIRASRCLVVGALNGIWVDNVKEGLTASQCIFAGNDKGVLVGGIGREPTGVVDDCLLFKNELALASEGGGGIHFSK